LGLNSLEDYWKHRIEGRILSMKRDQRGFTLMELMIVIVIIGVLAAIGVPAYKNYVSDAKNSACEANKRAIETAAGMYYMETGEGLSEYNTTKSPSNELQTYLANVTEFDCPWNKSDAKVGYGVEIDKGTGAITVTCAATHPTP
jgi:prepilin-type N-terminal cleavage/methylation domain-containing protein